MLRCHLVHTLIIVARVGQHEHLSDLAHQLGWLCYHSSCLSSF